MGYELPPIFRDPSPIGNNPGSSSGYQLPSAFQETQQPGWMPSTDYTRGGTYIVDVPYVSPENYQLPKVFTDPIDYSPQVVNIANNIKTQVQGIQSQIENNALLIPSLQNLKIEPMGIQQAVKLDIKQTPINTQQMKIQQQNAPGVFNIADFTENPTQYVTKDWAIQNIQTIENFALQPMAVIESKLDMDAIVKLTNGALDYVNKVYNGLDTAIKTTTPEFKLTPLASHNVTAAMEELKWRQNKVDLNSILPKMETSVQRTLILEDYMQKRAESLQKNGELKINPYDLAKQYTNADPNAIAQIFQHQKTPVNTDVIAKIQNGTATRSEINDLYGITRTVGINEWGGAQALRFEGYQTGKELQVNNIIYDPKRQRLNYSYVHNGTPYTKEIVMNQAEFDKLQDVVAKVKPWLDSGRGTPESDKTLTNVAAVTIEGVRINVGDEKTALKIGEALNGIFNKTVTVSVTDKRGDSRVLDKFEWREDYQISGNVISAPTGMAYDVNTGKYVKTQETLNKEKIAEEVRKQTALVEGRVPGTYMIGDVVTLDFNNGKIIAGGTTIDMEKTNVPIERQVESYTKTVQDFATNTDNAVLKTAANGFLALFASDDERMANAGLKVGYEQLKDMGKGEGQQDWSVFHSILSVSEYVIGNISGRITGIESEKKTLEQAYLGETNYYITDDGKTAANAAGKQWAETGKVGDIAGISSNAAKLMVLENADKNTVADIALNRQKDLAILAYNPFTKPVVMNALGKELTNEIISQNPLTQKEIESVNSDLMKSGMKAAVDQRLTGTFLDVPIGIALAITGGGVVANELELLAKGTKAASNMVKRAEDITDLVHYAKTASVLAKDSDLANTAILKATKASNIAVVTPSPGTIARGVTPNSIDIKKASSIEVTAAKAPLADKATAVKVKEFNADVQRAAAQPNVAAPSILTKTQMTGTSKTTNAQKLMDNIANGDASTIRATLVENIATDPSSLYKAMTVAAVKSDPATVTKAFQRLEEANQIYVKAANDLVKDVVDSGQGATRLAELSNSLGDATVIKMLDTAMGMGETGARIEPTPLINEITNIRREWETLRKIESTPVSVAPTGARQISQQAYDIENVMPDVVVSRINRVSSDVKINKIEDIASLSDEQITTLSKSNIGLEEKDLLNYREKASQILGKEGTALEDVSVTAFQRKETTPTSWAMGEKDTRLDDEYKALFSADNLKSQATAKKGDIEKLQTAAMRSIGRPLDTMEDFKSLTNKEIDALSKNVPSVSKSDITGYRVQATKEMDKLSQVRQTYDELGTKDYTDLVKLQQQRAADLASTADEYRNLLRNTERTDADEIRMGQLGVKLEEQRSILQATTEAIDARKMQMEQWKTKQLTAADIKPGTKDRKTAAINAIDAAKKGDYETAIKKFAEARTHDGRSVLSKVDAKHYDGMSIQRINRMEDAVPADQMSKGMKEMLERMRQERRDFAIDALSKKGDDFKRAAFKIKNGDELDELERLKLWNSGDEIRTLAKDALDDVNGNKLVKGLVDDAVKKGDAARAKNLQNSMKEELEKCIKRGECGGGAAAATAAATPIGKTLSAVGGSMIGLGMLAAAGLGVGMVNTADGKSWIKDNTTNTFYEIKPTTQRKGYVENTRISSIEQRISNLLSEQGFYGDDVYTEGSTPGVQGRAVDDEEYVCQNFAIDAANAINAKFKEEGIVAKVVNVYGHYNDDMEKQNHALIVLENRNKVINGYVDPISGKTVNLYEQRLMEPQSGYLGDYSGWDLSGSKMKLNGRTYTIESLQTMENAYQNIGTVWGTGYVAPKGDKMLYQTSDADTPVLDELIKIDTMEFNETVGRLDRIDPWGTTTSGTSKVV